MNGRCGVDHVNQHWLPRAYIKTWCDPSHTQKIIHRYDPSGNYLDYRPYSRVFSALDLYTAGEDGTRDTRTEAVFLKRIEDLFLSTRRRLDKGDDLTGSMITALALFVATTRNRSPRARDHWQGFKSRVVEVGEAMAQALQQATPAERKKMVTPSLGRSTEKGMSLDEAKAAAAEPFGRWLPRHIMLEAEILAKMTAIVLTAPASFGFITSDNPVAWTDGLAKPGQRARPIGLGHRFIEVTMPLSPQLAVLFDHSGQSGVANPSQDWVDLVNSRTLRHCNDCFISNCPTLEIIWNR
jgi:hypothetical protein